MTSFGASFPVCKEPIPLKNILYLKWVKLLKSNVMYIFIHLMIYLTFQMTPTLSLLKPLKMIQTPTTTKVQSLIRIGFFTCLMRQVMRILIKASLQMLTMFRQENQKTEKSKQKTLQKPRKKKVLTYPVTHLTLYPSKVQF